MHGHAHAAIKIIDRNMLSVNLAVCGEPGVTHKTIPLVQYSFNNVSGQKLINRYYSIQPNKRPSIYLQSPFK
jgi:hypothetical protein